GGRAGGDGSFRIQRAARVSHQLSGLRFGSAAGPPHLPPETRLFLAQPLALPLESDGRSRRAGWAWRRLAHCPPVARRGIGSRRYSNRPPRTTIFTSRSPIRSPWPS